MKKQKNPTKNTLLTYDEAEQLADTQVPGTLARAVRVERVGDDEEEGDKVDRGGEQVGLELFKAKRLDKRRKVERNRIRRRH